MYKLTIDEIEKVVNKSVEFLVGYCIVNNIHFVVTGISGGLDSAVSIILANKADALAKEKFNHKLQSAGIILPCESNPNDERLAKLVLEKFEIPYRVFDLTQEYQHINTPKIEDWHYKFFNKEISEKTYLIAKGNVKARLRMITLYDIAKKMNGIVLSNDNLSELLMGFWTIHGDVGDVGLIQNIFKGLELYDIARYLGVPDEIVNSKPKDGLGVTDGGDEDQLGAPYPVVDEIMIKLIKRGFDPFSKKNSFVPIFDLGFEPELISKLLLRSINTTYKRINSVTPSPSRNMLGLPEIKDINL